MQDIETDTLIIIFLVLIALSAFFSASETGLMTLNRYRLKHLAEKFAGARLAQTLLQRPDRLLGVLLLSSNLVNALASTVATIIILRLYGEDYALAAGFVLGAVLLIFTDLAPKTLAAIRPERVAFPSAYVFTVLLKLLYPLVYASNWLANGLLRLFGVSPDKIKHEGVSVEELRTVVMETSHLVPRKHQDMLLGLLNLETATVEDIMVPRNEIVALDLDDDWEDILNTITTAHRTRLPVYRGDINNILGLIHLRRVVTMLSHDELNMENLKMQIREAYFIPNGTTLYQQLVNFQANKRRTALVVNEYGDIQGLVTLEDILEEVVGEFTTTSHISSRNITPQEDGSFLVAGGAHIREINRNLGWHLPTDGPKTLNGLILEHMEMIPESGTSLMIARHPIEIIKTQNNAVQMTRISPPLSAVMNEGTKDKDKHESANERK
jgi:Mg2+/Co2+ transporter CorB